MTSLSERRRYIKELGRSTFAGYASLMRSGYRLFPHLRPINAALEQIFRGHLTRAIFALPPRHGKTYSTSELAPAYMIGNNPDMKFMQGAYGRELAQDAGRSVRDQLQSPLYHEIFDFGLSPNVTAARHFRTLREGMYLAGGVNSPFTGFGANWFNIDDPIKSRQDAESSVYRKGVIRWLQGVVYDRLENFDDGRENILTLCATRWHPEDMAGWMLKNLADEGFVYIALPAVADRFGRACDPDAPRAIPLYPDKYSL